MTSDGILEYEVVLLLAKYGERKLLSALAKRLGLSDKEIEDKLREINKIVCKRMRNKDRQPNLSIEMILANYPEKRKYLEILFARFQNRTFLPEFRDIKRFFDQHSADIGQLKSRTKATAKLFKLLGSLETDELASLSQASEQPEHSSLGIISDEIMNWRK